VTLFYDDRNALRWERHYSLHEPDDFGLLLFLPMVTELLDFESVKIPTPMPKPGFPPVEKLNLLPLPKAVQPNQSMLCTATAIDVNGLVQIRLTIVEQVPYTVARMTPETVVRTEVNAGVRRQVVDTVMRQVLETHYKIVRSSRVLAADGKTVQVTRKDGKTVDPKELLSLLAKETQVLLVPKGEVDPGELHKTIDDRTLIIRVMPSDPVPLPKQ
jgi:hypothetical protein